MHSKVQKWGNSLAVRIPRAFALEVGLEQNAEIDVSVREGAVVVVPRKAPAYTLSGLLSQVKDRKRHAEQDFGPATGREAW